MEKETNHDASIWLGIVPPAYKTGYRWDHCRTWGMKKHYLFPLATKEWISASYVNKIVKKNTAMAGITRNVYTHKLRITNITHMAEAGLSIREIQAQSEHLDTQSLIGYMQHTESRIRKGYDHTFKDLQETDMDSPGENLLVNTCNLGKEHYRKMAFKKYLDGEIDIKTLHSILLTLDKEDTHTKNRKRRKTSHITRIHLSRYFYCFNTRNNFKQRLRPWFHPPYRRFKKRTANIMFVFSPILDLLAK